MNNKFQELVENLRVSNISSAESMDLLRNSMEGLKCIILSGGPSLEELSLDELQSLPDDVIVIAVKQAYLKCPEIVDIHLINDDNFQLYDYSRTSRKPLVIKVKSPSKFKPTPGSNEDICFIIPKANVGFCNSLTYTKDFESGLITSGSLERPWGPGIMFEIGIYLPLFLGIKLIYISGWDLGAPNSNLIQRFYEQENWFQTFKSMLIRNSPWFYNKIFNRLENLGRLILFQFDQSVILNIPGVTKNEATIISNSTDDLHDWLALKGSKVYILSSISMVSQKFQRAALKDVAAL